MVVGLEQAYSSQKELINVKAEKDPIKACSLGNWHKLIR